MTNWLNLWLFRFPIYISAHKWVKCIQCNIFHSGHRIWCFFCDFCDNVIYTGPCWSCVSFWPHVSTLILDFARLSQSVALWCSVKWHPLNYLFDLFSYVVHFVHTCNVKTVYRLFCAYLWILKKSQFNSEQQWEGGRKEKI